MRPTVGAAYLANGATASGRPLTDIQLGSHSHQIIPGPNPCRANQKSMSTTDLRSFDRISVREKLAKTNKLIISQSATAVESAAISLPSGLLLSGGHQREQSVFSLNVSTLCLQHFHHLEVHDKGDR